MCIFFIIPFSVFCWLKSSSTFIPDTCGFPSMPLCVLTEKWIIIIIIFLFFFVPWQKSFHLSHLHSHLSNKCKNQSELKAVNIIWRRFVVRLLLKKHWRRRNMRESEQETPPSWSSLQHKGVSQSESTDLKLTVRYLLAPLWIELKHIYVKLS